MSPPPVRILTPIISDGLHLWGRVVATNILNKKLWRAYKGWYSRLKVKIGENNSSA
jgi:hypothetical protein